MREWTSEWPGTSVCIFGCSGPLCTAEPEYTPPHPFLILSFVSPYFLSLGFSLSIFPSVYASLSLCFWIYVCLPLCIFLCLCPFICFFFSIFILLERPATLAHSCKYQYIRTDTHKHQSDKRNRIVTLKNHNSISDVPTYLSHNRAAGWNSHDSCLESFRGFFHIIKEVKHQGDLFISDICDDDLFFLLIHLFDDSECFFFFHISWSFSIYGIKLFPTNGFVEREGVCVFTLFQHKRRGRNTYGYSLQVFLTVKL